MLKTVDKVSMIYRGCANEEARPFFEKLLTHMIQRRWDFVKEAIGQIEQIERLSSKEFLALLHLCFLHPDPQAGGYFVTLMSYKPMRDLPIELIDEISRWPWISKWEFLLEDLEEFKGKKKVDQLVQERLAHMERLDMRLIYFLQSDHAERLSLQRLEELKEVIRAQKEAHGFISVMEKIDHLIEKKKVGSL